MRQFVKGIQLIENNYENIVKLIESNSIDYTIKNNHNKTPIECIKDIQVATIIINDLNKKLDKFEEKFKILENKITNYSTLSFIKLKIHRNSIFIVFILLINVYIIMQYFITTNKKS